MLPSQTVALLLLAQQTLLGAERSDPPLGASGEWGAPPSSAGSESAGAGGEWAAPGAAVGFGAVPAVAAAAPAAHPHLLALGGDAGWSKVQKQPAHPHLLALGGDAGWSKVQKQPVPKPAAAGSSSAHRKKLLLLQKLQQLARDKRQAVLRRAEAKLRHAAALARVRNRLKSHASHVVPAHVVPAPRSPLPHYHSWKKEQEAAAAKLVITPAPSPARQRGGRNWLDAGFSGMATTAAPTSPPTPARLQRKSQSIFGSLWHHDTAPPTAAPVPTPNVWTQEQVLPGVDKAPTASEVDKDFVQKARIYSKSAKGGAVAGSVVDDIFHYYSGGGLGSGSPTPVPTPHWTWSPTQAPTPVPTPAPTPEPTASEADIEADMPPPPGTATTTTTTAAPTPMPTTAGPTLATTIVPTSSPTPAPSLAPTAAPTVSPTPAPTSVPTPQHTLPEWSRYNRGCIAGTFFWGAFAGEKYCAQCPRGRTSHGCPDSPTQEKTACGELTRDKVILHGPQMCHTVCERGRYLSPIKQGTCEDCRPGKFQPFRGQLKCTKCKIGQYQPYKRADGCSDCPHGKFAPEADTAWCDICDDCQAGTFGTTLQFGSTARSACRCRMCAAGRHSDSGWLECATCTTGKYQSLMGTGACRQCPLGKYADAAGQSYCHACAAGMYNRGKHRESCPFQMKFMSVRFGVAAPRVAALLAPENWKVVHAGAFKAHRHLIVAAFRLEGGVVALHDWNATSCCLSIAQDRRIVVDGYGSTLRSEQNYGFAYSVDGQNRMRCDRNRTVPFVEGLRYQFAVHGGTTNFVPLDRMPSDIMPRTMVGVGACKPALHYDAAPTLFWLAKEEKTHSAGSKFCRTEGGEEWCLVGAINKTKEERWCAAGRYRTNSGDCVGCDPGRYSDTPNAKRCVLCEMGRYAAGALSVDCDPCPAGTETSSKGAGSCYYPAECGIWNKGCKFKNAESKTLFAALPQAFGDLPTIKCVHSKWGSWAACSHTCGTGSRWREQKVLPPSPGALCKSRIQIVPCGRQPCPVDCSMTPLSAWSLCPVTCGGGLRLRRRSILRKNLYGGKACAPLKVTEACNNADCPVDCQIQTLWSMCSATCGIGTQSLATRIRNPAASGGACVVPDAKAQRVRPCHAGKCPDHCAVALWGSWSRCTVTCGRGGIQTRRREVQSAPSATCPRKTEQRQCGHEPCPEECVLSAWSEWSFCDKSCGNGWQERTRNVVRAAVYGGYCPHLFQSKSCNTQDCPIDCVVAKKYDDWDSCTKSCGGGVRRRFLAVEVQPHFGGNACPSLLVEKRCNDHPCPIDCAMTAYTRWGACSTACGAGRQVRSRSIVAQPLKGGRKCPTLTESRVCQSFSKCAKDCMVSKFSHWSACTATCGVSAIQTRKRHIVKREQFGGHACPHLKQQQYCNSRYCPQSCIVTKFTPYSKCSRTCGTGHSLRTREIVVSDSYGGTPCPKLFNIRACSTQPCTYSCVLTPWSDGGTCTRTCGGGTQLRTRSIVRNARFGGQACSPRKNYLVCSSQPCPDDEMENVSTDCVVSEYFALGACTQSCGGGGIATRHRTVTRQPAGNGMKCPILFEEQECNKHPCPIDCMMSVWGHWKQCTRTCGRGLRIRFRSIVVAPLYGGKPCRATVLKSSCNKMPCKNDCEVTAFLSWGACSVTCGGGMRFRSRKIVADSGLHGKACPSLSEAGHCQQHVCPMDCHFSVWSSWGGCSKSCDSGMKFRTRSVVSREAFGGKQCPSLEQRTVCKNRECVVDCGLSVWSNWGSCSQSCGVGFQRRVRSVIRQPAFGGHGCSVVMASSRACNMQACPENCVLSSFSHWSRCSRTCNSRQHGQQVRRAIILAQAIWGGKACAPIKQTRHCQGATECPLSCQVSMWEPWTRCSASCGRGGTQSRLRMVIRKNGSSGAACPPLLQLRECGIWKCPVLCEMSIWSTWSPCRFSCGGGTKARSRRVTWQAVKEHSVCSSLTETESCNTHACPQDTMLSQWGSWSTCTVSCGGGSIVRVRTIVTKARFGGKVLGTTKQFQPCTQRPCPHACVVSAFSAWSKCTASCGHGVQTKVRAIQHNPFAGGRPCPVLQMMKICNARPCPLDCATSTFKSWTPCSRSCGTGLRTRYRSIMHAAHVGGKSCPHLAETEVCASYACPTPCKVSDWSPWSACSKSCQGGVTFRSRSVLHAATHTTTQTQARCPNLVEKMICGVSPCPVHCKVSNWSAWTQCSQSCGGGVQRRHRSIVTKRIRKGDVCPSLQEHKECSTQPCPQACVMGAFSKWSACSTTCGSGRQHRSRSVKHHGFHGGSSCGATYSNRACSAKSCPVDCIVDEFSSWSMCSASCGGGTRKRRRSIMRSSSYGGKTCPTLEELMRCSQHPCPVECKVSLYSQWTSCPATCLVMDHTGKPMPLGSRHRKRQVLVRAQYGGAVCPQLVQSWQCPRVPCPHDCKVSTFGPWGPCSVTCGGGYKSRHRVVHLNARASSFLCPSLTETAICGRKHCPVDCKVSAFHDWTTCGVSCLSASAMIRSLNGLKVPVLGAGLGIALQTTKRHRSILRRARFNGKSCPSLTEKKRCSLHSCPRDCNRKAAVWSQCTRTCGSGFQIQSHEIVYRESYGGKPCPDDAAKIRACNTKPCPLDCMMEPFIAWTPCSSACGSGYRVRYRSVVTPASFGGIRCTHTSESQKCAGKCKGDCIMSAWAWHGPCSRTCGGGKRQRTRKVITEPKHGGKVCSALHEDTYCGSSHCPIHCFVGAWGVWSRCSRPCGGGTKFRHRTAVKQTGAVCPLLKQIQPCSDQACSVDCQLSNPSPWTPCSAACGGGAQFRWRSLITAPKWSGKSCGVIFDSRQCNLQPCANGCQLTAFTPWSKCSATCGSGFQTRNRGIVRESSFGGKPCGVLIGRRTCMLMACVRDCKVSWWGSYSPCSKTCGGGIRHRSRRITVAQNSASSKSCPVLVDSSTCSSLPCPVDCIVAAFAPWSECPVTCGTGLRRRLRRMIRAPAFGGKACGPTDEVGKCGTSRCPKLCQLSSWSPWTKCSATCDGGTTRRVRLTLEKPGYGAKECDELEQLVTCADWSCPVECDVSEFSNWGPCTHSCGGGKKSRERTMLNQGAKPLCPPLKQVIVCNAHECPIDCKISEWGAWAIDCTHVCNGGTRMRTRRVIVPPRYGGKKCPQLRESKKCNMHNCPVDCKVGSFSLWTSCDRTCGGGKQSHFRSVTRPAAYGGLSCAHTSESRLCKVDPCPLDCRMGRFAPWSACSPACGHGTQLRSRGIFIEAAFGGARCQHRLESRVCHSWCKADCKMSPWHSSGSCAQTCGKSVRVQLRSVLVHPENGGAPCGPLVRLISCNLGPCPYLCRLSPFKGWSKCTKDCGAGGTQTRSRTIVSHDSGFICPHVHETRSCNENACSPLACHISSWGQWSACSARCGGGMVVRSRTILNRGEYPSSVAACPQLQQTEVCNQKPCSVDCIMTLFTAWTPCPVSCGGGTQNRHRSVARINENGGKTCPARHEKRSCRSTNCPQDCEVSGWYGDPCIRTCGVGSRTMKRDVKIMAENGGVSCPALVVRETCHLLPCAGDCKISPFGPWSACSATCGQGFKHRRRMATGGAAFGGRSCPAVAEVKLCVVRPCTAECKMSSWAAWGPCSAVCGNKGAMLRTRKVIVNGAANSTACKSIPTIDKQKCGRGPCADSCRVSQFSSWSACTRSCGSGTQTRSRKVLRHSTLGFVCPRLKQTRSCSWRSCSNACTLSAWSDWTSCSAVCGGGIQARSRHTMREATGGGQSCPPLIEHRRCNRQQCALQCAVSQWSSWRRCTQSCGKGSQVRTRVVLHPAERSGSPCPALAQTQQCQSKPCPHDCVAGSWGTWSACTVSCGSGHQTKRRSLKKAASFGGRGCHPLEVRRACGVAGCAIACSLSVWGEWGRCSASCGAGAVGRWRKVTQKPAFGGVVCSSLSQQRLCATTPCPVDCRVSGFGKLSPCSKSCGGGTRTRFRHVEVAAQSGGKICPALSDAKPCATHPCPQDCTLTTWSTWGHCSRTCGTGRQARKRTITTASRWGGRACAPTRQVAYCNHFSCKTFSQCRVTPYSKWGSCTKTCGGTMSRSRQVLSRDDGESVCPALTETRACGSIGGALCPRDCKVSSFSVWTHCSEKCGGGRQTRVRHAILPAEFLGKSCGALRLSRTCNTRSCPVDCIVSPWGTWLPCSHSCGGGTRKRYRSLVRKATRGGAACPQLIATGKCPAIPCPVDCVVSAFVGWSPCTRSCGGGVQAGSSKILRAPDFGGAKCRGISRVRACYQAPCPVDCTVSAFNPWTPCSKLCGHGQRTRSRWVTRRVLDRGGKLCPHLSEVQSCYASFCEAACKLSRWTKWTDCTGTCGTGEQTRTRTASWHRRLVGADLPVLSHSSCPATTGTRLCNSFACPVDCKWGRYGDWGTCSKSCGIGRKTQFRSIVRDSAFGGMPCRGSSENHSECNAFGCPGDCIMGAWGNWGECGAGNGGMCALTKQMAHKVRSRIVLRRPFGGGKICVSTSEHKVCAVAPCAHACVLTAWTKWNSCSQHCGTSGTKMRTRAITSRAASGAVCPPTKEVQTCNLGPCSRDCKVTTFARWTKCTVSCGTGVKARARAVVAQARPGGSACPPLTQVHACGLVTCPVDCAVGAFGVWSACSRTCGSGHKFRRRSISVAPQYGGKECPALAKVKRCNTYACPTDCVLQPFGAFSPCSKTCGSGQKQRSRAVSVAASSGGKACAPLTEAKACESGACPLDCLVSSWVVSHGCSVSCGRTAGTMVLAREILTKASHGGRACPPTRQSQRCFRGTCPEHCYVTPFEDWGKCSASCGGGVQVRRRSVVHLPRFGGSVCPALLDTRPCNMVRCKQDCTVASFDPWSRCTVTCGGGTQSRQRGTVRQQRFGGQGCPHLVEQRKCGTAPCPVDCSPTPYSDWTLCSTMCGEGTQERFRSIGRAATFDGRQCPKVLHQIRSCFRWSGCSLHKNVFAVEAST